MNCDNCVAVRIVGRPLQRFLLRDMRTGRRFKAVIAIVLSLAAIACSPARELDLEAILAAREALELVRRTEFHIARGDYHRAIVDYRSVLEALPDASHAATLASVLQLPDAGAYRELLAKLHNNLGLVYFRSRQFERAAREYELALEIDARYPAAIANLAVLRVRQKQFSKASLLYETLAGYKRLDARESALLGTALREQGRFDHARDALSTALRQAANPRSFSDVKVLTEAHYECGLTLQAKGELEPSVRHFEAALAMTPGHVETRYQLARSLALSGDQDSAATAKSRFEKDAESIAYVQGLLADGAVDADRLFRSADAYEYVGSYYMAWSRYRQLALAEPERSEAKEALIRLRGILKNIRSVSRFRTAEVLSC
jgi:tetratricopeptide (TPR) repeat protein